ncbi:MAG TPA: hypothetical protein VGO47_08000 [Chlamydiales bacterium]|nr:hypothetical protein [Chlamydiales bacterium]
MLLGLIPISLAAAVVVNFAYGYKIEPVNDPIVNFLDSNAATFAKATRPGAYLVDSFPIRTSSSSRCDFAFPFFYVSVKHLPAWCPGASFKSEAKEVRGRLYHTRDIPFRDVKDQLVVTFPC